MNSINEILIVEDLIDSDVEESTDNSHALWTEQALDLFISMLQSVIHITFVNEREMFRVVSNKMSSHNFNFTLDQIEYKYNGLKQMYNDKKQRNQEIEPELVKLFGDVKPNILKRPKIEKDLQTPLKKPKTEHSPDISISRLNKSSDDDENDKCKIIWTAMSNKYFIELLEELRPHLGTVFRTKKQMWLEISKRLKMRGFNYSWGQIENKWKYLVRHYRNRMDMQKHEQSNSKLDKRKSPPSAGKPSSSRVHKKTKKEEMEIISFANDQKLPFDDDVEDDFEAEPANNDEGQFEETCSLPEVNADSTENTDPVHVDEGQFLPNAVAMNDLSLKLDQISKEMSYFRRDLRKVHAEMLAIKKEQLEVCKEQKEQFAKFGNSLNELVLHLKRRDGEM